TACPRRKRRRTSWCSTAGAWSNGATTRRCWRGVASTRRSTRAGSATRAPRRPDRSGAVRITVLGGGSWGTTVASIVAKRNPTVLWARDPDVAREIDERHTNARYLEGFALSETLPGTRDPD